MRKITVTEGLNELKLYDSKITKGVNSSKFCGATKKSSDKVWNINREDFNERAKASYQSDIDLIKNRNTLKSAIVYSNAITMIKVADKEMTRAEAIERKKSICYEKVLLKEMKQQYALAVDTVNKENKKVDEKVDNLILTLVGKDSDKKLSPADQEAIEKPYRETNEFEIIDPINLLEKIEKLESEIDKFESNVDSALVLSNATTFIELDF